jgi:uncharacterized membrane protein YozB (DUF420 family)
MKKEENIWLIILVSSVVGALTSHYLPETPPVIFNIELVDMIISAVIISGLTIFFIIIGIWLLKLGQFR